MNLKHQGSKILHEEQRKVKVKGLEQHATPKQFERQQITNPVISIHFQFIIHLSWLVLLGITTVLCFWALDEIYKLSRLAGENVKCKQCFDWIRHFCGAKKLGPDYTFIHCLRIYLLLVSPVRECKIKNLIFYLKHMVLTTSLVPDLYTHICWRENAFLFFHSFHQRKATNKNKANLTLWLSSLVYSA